MSRTDASSDYDVIVLGALRGSGRLAGPGADRACVFAATHAPISFPAKDAPFETFDYRLVVFSDEQTAAVDPFHA